MATNGQTQTQTTVTSDGFAPTDYDQVQTLTRTVKESHHGHKVDFQVDSKTDDVLSGSFDDRVKSIVNGAVADALAEREKRENYRANKRNFNRMLTLFGALVIGLVVTYVLTTPGLIPQNWKFLAPYTFVITIVLDSGLALYGYIRKY